MNCTNIYSTIDLDLCQIIRNGAEYTRKSECTVEVDESMPWVSIGTDVFLQGYEAEEFLEEAERLWNEAGDVTEQEVFDHLAQPYLDC